MLRRSKRIAGTRERDVGFVASRTLLLLIVVGNYVKRCSRSCQVIEPCDFVLCCCCCHDVVLFKSVPDPSAPYAITNYTPVAFFNNLIFFRIKRTSKLNICIQYIAPISG